MAALSSRTARRRRWPHGNGSGRCDRRDGRVRRHGLVETYLYNADTPHRAREAVGGGSLIVTGQERRSTPMGERRHPAHLRGPHEAAGMVSCSDFADTAAKNGGSPRHRRLGPGTAACSPKRHAAVFRPHYALTVGHSWETGAGVTLRRRRTTSWPRTAKARTWPCSTAPNSAGLAITQKTRGPTAGGTRRTMWYAVAKEAAETRPARG